MAALESRTVCITPGQRLVHVTTEAASILVYVPFLVWLSYQKKLPPWARRLSLVLGVAALVVDGGLLLRWRGVK